MRKIISSIIILIVTVVFVQCTYDYKHNHEIPLRELKLNKSYVQPYTNKVKNAAIISGNGNYTVFSDDEKIATAKIDVKKKNSFVVIKGVAVGETTVKVTDVATKKTISLKVKVKEKPADIEGDTIEDTSDDNTDDEVKDLKLEISSTGKWVKYMTTYGFDKHFIKILSGNEPYTVTTDPEGVVETVVVDNKTFGDFVEGKKIQMKPLKPAKTTLTIRDAAQQEMKVEIEIKPTELTFKHGTPDELSMDLGSEYFIQIEDGNGGYSVVSSAENVVSAVMQQDTKTLKWFVKIESKSEEETATITVKDQGGEEKKITIKVESPFTVNASKEVEIKKGKKLVGKVKLPDEGLVCPEGLFKKDFSGTFDKIISIDFNEVVTINDKVCYYLPNLLEVEMPKVQTIGDKAFYQAKKLAKVAMNVVAEIGDFGFAYCRSLQEISLPTTIKTIDKKAFYNCINLEKITIHATTPPTLETDGDAFTGIKENAVLYVPKEALSSYINSEFNIFFKDRIKPIE